MKRSLGLLSGTAILASIVLLGSARPVSASDSDTQNCCNQSLKFTSGPTVSVGSTSAQIDWTLSGIGDSNIWYGTNTPSWRTVQQSGTTTFEDVAVVDSQIQWAIDNGGRIVRTFNGWLSYTVLPFSFSSNQTGIAATAGDTAWVVADSQIYHTTNAGQSWTTQAPAWIAASGRVLKDIVMRDSTEGIAVGSAGTILETTDGTTWNCITGSDPSCASNQFGSGSINFNVASGYFESATAKHYVVAGTGGVVAIGNGSPLTFTSTPGFSSQILSLDMTGPDTIWATDLAGNFYVKHTGVGAFTTGIGPGVSGRIVGMSETTAFFGASNGSIYPIDTTITNSTRPAVTITPAPSGGFFSGARITDSSITFVGANGLIVRYDANYTSVASNPATPSTSRSVLLTGLLPGTTYHFIAISVDTSPGVANWKVAESTDATFTTAGSSVATTVVKSIGTAPGRDFSSLNAWEAIRDGNLVTRTLFNVTNPVGTFNTTENVVGQSSGCSGIYIPENQVRTNGPIMTLDNLSGTCTPGETLLGSGGAVGPSGATAQFQSVAWSGGTTERGEVYNDSVFTTAVTIDGSFTDAGHTIILTNALGQRHTGTRGTGARIQLSGGTPITILDRYVTVDGLALDLKTRSSAAPSGITVQESNDTVADVLMYDGDFTGINVTDFTTNDVLRNNILLDNDKLGETASIEYTASHNLGDTLFLYNNTVYGSGSGGIGFGTGSSFTMVAKNNIVVGSKPASGDYVLGGGSFSGSSNNLSSDATAPGPNSLINRAASAMNFVSTIPGAEDLRTLAGSPAISAGIDLTSTGFSTDVRGRPRTVPWDLGAYEVDSTPPSPLAVFNVNSTYASGTYNINMNITGCSTDPESGVAGYNVYINGVFRLQSNTCPKAFTMTGFLPGTTYQVTVRAVNNDGFETAPNPADTQSVTTPSPSLTLAAAPTSITTTAGGTPVDVTLTTTSVNGYAGTVNLTQTVSGGTGQFLPATSFTLAASGTNSSTWRFTPGTVAGTYSATLTAKDSANGAITDSKTITITIGDFSVSAPNPTSATTNVGTPTSFTLTVTPASGFTSSNTTTGFTAALPSGITATFSPTNPFNLSGNPVTVTVTLTATSPGTYTLTPQVTANGVTRTAPSSFTLTVLQPDFSSPSLNPSSATVNQGASTPLTATITSLNGYSGTVTTTVTGMPVGVTVSNNGQALALASGGNITPSFTVTVGNSVPAGTYTMTVTATDGTRTHAATFALTVSVFQDFTIDIASSKSVTVAQGTNATYTVVATPQGSFSGSITVTVPTSSPSGVVANALTLNGPSYSGTLTIPTTALGGASSITYTLTVRGTAGGTSRDVPPTVQLTVSPNPDFTLTNPSGGQTIEAGQTATYTFSVSATGGYSKTVTFSLGYAATDPGFSAALTPSSVVAPPVSGTSVTLQVTAPYSLAAASGSPYTITLTGSDGTKTHTLTFPLTVKPDSTPPIITNVTATPGSCGSPTNCSETISWQTDDPSNSTVQYSIDVSYASSASDTANVKGHNLFLSGLTETTQYHYYVKSCNVFGLCADTQVASSTFTTPTSPDLSPPVINSITVSPLNPPPSTVVGVITITVNATDDKGVASVLIAETGPLHGNGQTLATLTGAGPNYSTTWDTNDPAAGDNNGSVTLTATATDGSGKQTSASIVITINNDKTPPVITSNPQVSVVITLCQGTEVPPSPCAGSGAGTAVASLTWTTDEVSTTAIAYGLEKSDGSYTYSNQITLSGGAVYTTHRVDLVGLALNARYHYEITSCDPSNNCVH